MRFHVADWSTFRRTSSTSSAPSMWFTDAVDPLGLMKSIRGAVKHDGTYLMLEMNCSPKLEENANPVGRLLYAVSTLYCMTTSLVRDGAGIGAAMGEPKARELASQAGFREFRKLPIDDPFSRLYELRP